MKKIIRLGLAFLIISFMVVSFQKFDCVAAVKTINVSKTEASGQDLLAVPHLQKKAPTSQLFSFLKDSPDVIASGISGTCKWEITADGILTIDKGQLATGTVPISGNDTNCGSNWTANGNKDKIKKVEIKPGVSLPKDATAVFANLPNVTEIEGLENLDTSETTNISYLFYYCKNLTSLDLSSFNTSQVTDMKYMFYLCYSLTSLNVSNFNTRQVADMKYMFFSCNKLTSLDVSKFDTSQVTDMSRMFDDCRSLTSLDVSNFNTSQVTKMNSMFNNCYNLSSINVSNFNTSKVTNMYSMFGACGALTTLDLSNLDTSKVNNMNYIFNSLKVWKLTLGNKFELKAFDSWPRQRESSLPYTFYDGKLRYITINRSNSKYIKDFEWREVGTGNDSHNPQGTIYKPYDDSISTNYNTLNAIAYATNKAVSNKTPITFVWNHKPYNASPSLKFTDSSYKEPIKEVTSGTSGKPYAYPYDSRFYKSESYPALNIYGTLQDEDSSQVTLSYWIDDNSTNKKEVKQPVNTTSSNIEKDKIESSNGEKNDTKVNWSFAITNQDDLTALATYKKGGHTIHVEARDNGIDGQSQDWFIPASATFEAPVAENAIVKFKYQDSSGKQLRDPQTLVRGATDSFNNYSDGYVYNVKQYIPRYLWGKDKDNLLRYGIDNYYHFLSELTWGNVDTVKFENGNLNPTGENGLEITLTYGEANTISLEVPENLNFGSNILQNIPSKLGLNYPVGKPPKLAVKDTTTDKSWTIYLSITKFINTKDPSKTLDGIFYYNNKPVDSGSEATIAEGGDFYPNTDHIYSISNSWYSDGKQQTDKGPWLNLQGQRPAEGTYQATATWTLKNTPQ
ncbi:BspA family leucine-rich repeat surface protein [Lactobacillus mellis]|uniref:BspA family leucine-rich repeat surface protein n=1 Tax=Bombilactobacillus mellis TaxID=1218508 RepID=UPI0015812433|nr:BspA family leucine-rich repeat surface protein [Bombilactobacillus mellis]NUG38690.1 BspA family leucine-rich repeat surface protein [Bombilactobacillus mellis]